MISYLSHHSYMMGFAALGAVVHWMWTRYGKDFDKGLELFISEIYSLHLFKIIPIMIIYAFLGSLVSVILAGPTTERQALAAGLGWTTLLGGTAAAVAKKKGKAVGG